MTKVHVSKSDETGDNNEKSKQDIVVKALLNYDESPHFFPKFTLAGCPPGLEILDRFEHLLIHRKLQSRNGEDRLLAYSQFEVKNTRGMKLYMAVEKVKRSTLIWNRDARLFNVTFYDFHCRKVFKVKRQNSFKYCFAQYVCLFFTYGFSRCGNAVKVTLPHGELIGFVRQKLSFSSTVLHIYNSANEFCMIIRGITQDGILDVFFPGEDEPIAMVEVLMDSTEASDFYRVSVPYRSSTSGITFFKNFLTPEQKALLLSSTVLLDYIFLKPTSDYIHLSEVIPKDYIDYPSPKSTLHRCESEELIILEEMESKVSDKRTEYRCCGWFWRLCCAWYFLGLKRNVIRCVLLTIAIVIVAVLLGLLALLLIVEKNLIWEG